MNTRSRNILIVVVVALAAVCLCMAVAGIAALTSVVPWAVTQRPGLSRESERIEQTFDVGRTATLEVSTFAGSVTVQAGESSNVHMVATKRAPRRSDLDRIEVETSQRGEAVVIATKRPRGLTSASVALEITTPPGTRVDVGSGSGSVEVRGLSGDVNVDTVSGSVEIVDVTGKIDAHTASGRIEVRGGRERVRVDTGSGSIRYGGEPQGRCRFESGSGSITLELPSDLNMEVDVATGSGDIDVDFRVDGEVTESEAVGTIGDGSGGSIYVRTGSGTIRLIRR
jgi:DUF4097 and DUF4098 domain-containing protein YvlB